MELEERYADFKAIGAEVLTVSVDSAEEALLAVEGLGLEFPVLYDSTTSVAQAWGVFNLLNDNVSAPATYVFNRSGDLIAYHIANNIADRPSTEEILDTLASSQ